VKLRVKMRVPGFKKLALGIQKCKEVEEQVGLVLKSLRAAERRSDRISMRK
jgi:peptidyl-tRNA hydrolase